jgi:hypothetical protein
VLAGVPPLIPPSPPAPTTTMEHRGGQNNGNAPSSW